MQNARTWSHESRSEDDTIRPGNPLSTKSPSAINIPAPKNIDTGRLPVHDVDGDMVADGFFFHDAPKKEKMVSHVPRSFSPQSPRRYSPPSKRDPLDKWSVLGERRRRAYTGSSETERSPEHGQPRRQVGFGFTGFGTGTGSGTGVWDNKLHHAKDKGIGCPWGRPRGTRDHQQQPTPRKNSGKGSRKKQAAAEIDLGHDHDHASDLEWVGGWHELHL